MLRVSQMTYDFKCGAIAETINRSPRNVQHHLQLSVFRKATQLNFRVCEWEEAFEKLPLLQQKLNFWAVES